MKNYILFSILGLSLMVLVSCDIGSSPPEGNQQFSILSTEVADPLYGYRIDDPENRLLPLSIDHSENIPIAGDQGKSGSCTAWAIGYYLKTFQEAVEEGWDKNENAFSPMYLFAMQCQHYSKPYSFITAWNALKHYGCVKWSTMPYEDLQLAFDLKKEMATFADFYIPESAHTEARHYRCGDMYRLFNLNQVKQTLTLTPVLLAIDYYSTPHRNPSPEENFISYDPNKKAPHTVVCTGYDDSKFGVGALQFINSCGVTWGEHGYSWIQYPDFAKIVKFALSIQDIPNVKSTSAYIEGEPEAPSNVVATENIGPYVDLSWDKVKSARYYRIYRAQIDDPKTYDIIGMSYKNRFRDYPLPGMSFHYSVVSVNELGDSEHHATDNDIKDYVGKGMAKGAFIPQPHIKWIANNLISNSLFKVSNIDNMATSLQVCVSSASEGPWHSLGWITTGDFRIYWGRDSEYVGKRPYIKVRSCNAYGYSVFSDAAHVAQTIASPAPVASIRKFNGYIGDDTIHLYWETDGKQVDFFELWRYRAAEDEANDWVLAGYADGNEFEFQDMDALPGISYYYAILSVYQGTSSAPKISENPIKIPDTQPNLYLYDFKYRDGLIDHNPVQFELTVWNEGCTQITDYSIAILVFDENDQSYYEISSIFNASKIAKEGQLPLSSGEYHTLSLFLSIPLEFADGCFYSWGIWIDYLDKIQESYELDNFLVGCDVWWAFADSLSSERDLTKGDESENISISNTRPFSKKWKENLSFKTDDEKKGPIPFKRPSFCNNHVQ